MRRLKRYSIDGWQNEGEVLMLRKFKQYLKFIFLVGVLFIMGRYLTLLAEAERIDKEECFRNFDIDNVNFEDPEIIPYIPLLADYFQCRAAVRDDINECDNLSPWPDRIENCRRYFEEYHGFFGRLLMEGRVTPPILTTWKNQLNLSIEECRLLAEAWLAEDISICEKFRRDKAQYNECRAMIKGDPIYCRADPCRNKALYTKAIRSGDIKECEKIKGEMSKEIKMMCQGYISGDEKICEKNKGFEEFRNKYYDIIRRR